MTDSLLSICIPTYNFGQYVGETLASIVSQVTDEVEIVVLDGASTDDTSSVIRKYQALCPRIKYHRLDAKGGIDRDMARSVDLAGGQYCWLFGSDDLMNPGSIERVLAEIKSGRDLYLCRHLECTIDMKVIRSYPVLKRSQKDTFDLSDTEERLRYFELADTTEAFFSFIGGIIVKRSKWNAVPLNPAFIGSCWAHAARLFELMPKGLSLKYIREPLLSKRSGNDSFSTQGFVKRYGITIDGYHAIADRFFGSASKEAYHVRRVVRSEFGLKMFLSAKMACKRNPIVEDRKLLDSLLHKTFCDFSLRGLAIQFAYFVIPVWLYVALRKLLKKG